MTDPQTSTTGEPPPDGDLDGLLLEQIANQQVTNTVLALSESAQQNPPGDGFDPNALPATAAGEDDDEDAGPLVCR